jgi:MFS transporter, ACS family, hexuronate transporter
MESMWNAVLLIGLAAAAHQGFSANLYTLTSDMFPSPAIGWYWRNAWRARWAVDRIARRPRPSAHRKLSDSFFVAGVEYFLALGVIQLLAPRLEPARLVVE